MCGRYSLTKKQIRFASRFSKEELQLFLKERYNIAPTQTVPLIHIFGGELKSDDVRWGLQPAWSKAPIINAKCEGILGKRTFRESILHRRCLIPADGFYEWRGKTPFHFTLPDGEVFYFGGIMDTWSAPDGRSIQCCCIITTAANEAVSPFHTRMPVVVGRDDRDGWLDPAASPKQFEEVFKNAKGATFEASQSTPLVPDGAPRLPKPSQGELSLS